MGCRLVPSVLVLTVVWFTGNVRAGDVTLEMAGRKSLTISRATIAKVEVSRGQYSKGHGVLIGTAIGTGLLGIVAAIACGAGDCDASDAGVAASAAVAFGASVGAIIGVVVPPASAGRGAR